MCNFVIHLAISFLPQQGSSIETPVDDGNLTGLQVKIHQKGRAFPRRFPFSLTIEYLRAVLRIPTLGNAVQPSEARVVQFYYMHL